MFQFHKLFFSCFLFVGLSACKTQALVAEQSDLEKLPKLKDKELIDRIDSLSHIEPKTFYSKLALSYQDLSKPADESEISVKTSIKIVSDSAVSAIITYARIPVVTALVTQDTLSVVNKRDRCYTVASLDYLKELFGVDFSYENIEEIIYGKPLDYQITQKYFVDNDPFQYSISTHKKHDRKRPDRKQRDDLMIQYHLTNDAKGLKQTRIWSLEDATEVSVVYLERQQLNGFDLPLKVEINIRTPKKTLLLTLLYERVEVNEPQELIIVIPESYEKCD
ncbi:MAG: DUF4292 domain-containing protein [Crocinitomicaceae bacterium]|jgi:hypothetical protein|nr:DUF4292 domain-containing protein [Crocinitomicaceae bacterium]MDP4722765.1 DUF4292 domain-containing protein [Crocinitomicaceae bacterium]MDP4739543.1 DUF4292 domain-containing protein [Crocinitomicaceae bacterium]MDP4798711.1 DUF4292 domain-containing protein [Crocinitomicaceae bacterium]MDP4807510.1 DUF4292 domain-containing protein [Crocinitomicaceae bacterium]